MINLISLTDNYTIYQINNSQKIPTLILESEFYSITKTKEEISIVTNCDTHYEDLKSDRDWRGFKVEGILDFTLIGIINEIGIGG
jgi:hypothetical protein